MKLSIVIPVYNEANTILEIVERVQKCRVPPGIEKEINIIDDCSTDGTRELLKSFDDSDIHVYLHDQNQGKGSALKTGFSRCTGDIVLIQDADLEYNPDEYPKLLDPILKGKADVVFGSRFAGGEAHRVLYFWHSVANKMLTLLSNMLSDLNLTDMETCYKVFKREVLEKIDIEEKRFGFEPEITAKVARLSRDDNVAVYEVGISYHGRTYDEGKKIGLKDAIRAFWCVLKYNTSKFAYLIKYAFNGIIVAFSQFVTIIALVELLGFSSKLLKNVAYAISIEVSIIFGFLLHAYITWRYRFQTAGHFVVKLLMFQLVTSISFLVRQGVFYLLLETGIDYRLNTLIGIAIAMLLNFIGYSSIVFKEREKA